MITLIQSAIRLAAAFLFGSTGEIITEKSGHLNLGIPGIMCVGAAGGCMGCAIYMNGLSDISKASGFICVLSAVFFCFLTCSILGLIYCFLTVSLRVNQNITGLALTTFGIGLSDYIISSINTQYLAKASKFFTNVFPFHEKLGVFGKLVFSYGILVYSGIIIAILVNIFFKKTKVGLKLRAVGENPATADACGVNVGKYRYFATIAGCSIAGLGGLFYIMDYIQGNWEYSIDAIGWLAVALVIFAVWKTNYAIIGSIIFGALYIAPNYINCPTQYIDLFKMLPYVVTIVVLIITSIIGHKEVQPPQSLGQNYFREDR